MYGTWNGRKSRDEAQLAGDSWISIILTRIGILQVSGLGLVADYERRPLKQAVGWDEVKVGKH